MTVKPLTEHHLEYLGLKGGYTCSSESTLVKIPHCWKSHVTAQLFYPLPTHLSVFSNVGVVARKPVFGGLRTTNVQTRLRIRAV